jgi:hypothetical protein
MCRQAGFSQKTHVHANTMSEAVAHVIAGNCITLLPESAIALPLAADVKLVRCDAREEWYALWNPSNGKPEPHAVVEALKDSSPAGWPNTLKTLQTLEGHPKFETRARFVAASVRKTRALKRVPAKSPSSAG